MTSWGSTVKKKITYWAIPLGFQELIRSFLSLVNEKNKPVASDPEENAILIKNSEILNLHKGQRCFILATGPSINRQNLALLQNEICIAVSNLFVHPDYKTINPQYYCIAPFHHPISEDAWQAWMSEIDKKTLNSTLIFGLTDRGRNETGNRFQNRRTHYIKFDGTFDKFLKSGVDLTKTTPRPQSVTVMALFVAIYMGFNEIYLLGCDHDWIFNLGKSSHFYAEDQHAMKRSGYDEWQEIDFGSEFASNANLWQQYMLINRLAHSLNIEIYNATNGGILDVFPWVRFEDLVTK
jgi:hypothetical protein